MGPKVEIWDRRAALGEIWDIGLRAAPATGPQSAVLKTDTILGQLPTLENQSDGRDRLFWSAKIDAKIDTSFDTAAGR